MPVHDRQQVLGEGWQDSPDVAWTTTSDAHGFHILTAPESSAYGWKTLASLSEPGFDADAWIGNVCVTGSGKRAVVVYAPRTFTNDARLMARGGFTAVVDLASGGVTKLDVTASLSYYNPGCGVGETAVLTQSPGEDRKQTRLITVDAVTGRLGTPVVTEGQVTSATQSKDGIVAAFGSHLVSVDAKGAKKVLTKTSGTPYRITPEADGGLLFIDRQARKDKLSEATAFVKRLPTGGRPSVIGEGKLSAIGLTSAAGTAYLTGDVSTVNKLPHGVARLKGSGKDAIVSTAGRAVVERTVWADGVQSPAYLNQEQATDARSVNITTTIRDTGERAEFTVRPLDSKAPNWEEGRNPSPRLVTEKQSGAAAAGAAGSPTEIVESERVCSVPRNDPRNQAMQPKPRQVEWAVDQAVTGTLNAHIARPVNWKNLGMPAYRPQSLFPNPVLQGGGRVPAQILLGITAQESNMWQAARSAVPGVTANPLIGNYYGIDLYDGNSANDWDVNFAEADCGYGITQVTDHMRMAGRENGHGGAAWDYQKQRAVALDYTANVAAGLQILVQKWNQTKKAGVVVHDGDPRRLENWFFALWAYNSGFYENVNHNEPWGVGWANNPANPEWDAGRTPFMEDRLGNEDASAAARPQHWPYPEKVLGFAAHPPAFIESPGKMVAAFRAAWWNGKDGDATITGSAKQNRARLKPPEDLFCGPYNECDPAKISDGASNKDKTTGPCQRDSDYHCWWHQPVSWKTDCPSTCGNEFMRFNSSYPEEADGTAYPPNCTNSGLPVGALIIDDLPAGTPVIRPGCTNSTWTNQGTFGFTFSNNGKETTYPSKVDLHQLGAGFGGHFYFGHTRKADAKGNRLKVTGTWKLNKSINGAAKIMVHLPDHGAHTLNAKYEVQTAQGTRTRDLGQKGDKNRWVSIGAFLFNNVPTVKLSTTAPDGTGDEDIAFDAIAIVPINAKYVERSLTAASIFDPNQSLNSNMPSTIKSPLRTMSTLYDWAISRSYRGPSWEDNRIEEYGVSYFPRCAKPGEFPTTAPCTGQKAYDAARAWYQQVKDGGKAVRADGGVPAMSIPMWMAMSNRRPNPSQSPGQAYADNNDYKIKSDIMASYLVDGTGKIIPDTQYVDGDVLIGNAHLPQFVVEIMKGIEADYGIPIPNIRYSGVDALRWGDTRAVDPLGHGDVPGQAYKPHMRGGRISPDGKCIDTRLVGGGVHGYRPMVAQSHVDKNVKAWLSKVNAHSKTHVGIRRWAGDVYSMFFKNEGLYPGDDHNTFGSSIGNAPPIWQDIAVAFCTDGSVKPKHLTSNDDAKPSTGIVYQSYMPDLYLYVDGKMVDNLGKPSTSRIQAGHWINFSNIPGVNSTKGNAFGKCDVAERGNGGNPWNVGIPFPVVGNNPGYRPNRLVHCDQPAAYFTETYTP
ncbi:hypothetical protein [Streptomyces sp. NPDC051211]|uniref:golvesin C-terminal-like domain-containing protein n=1 Tax=Streptomyces sp. NPDC051211 TaxID=3154643 RepID=UPI00344D33A7